MTTDAHAKLACFSFVFFRSSYPRYPSNLTNLRTFYPLILNRVSSRCRPRKYRVRYFHAYSHNRIPDNPSFRTRDIFLSFVFR